MAKASSDKTNVMRLLEQKKISYTPHSYPHADVPVDGVTVAGMIGVEPARVFKTLVARGASKSIYVFVIPVARELDLKKAAKSVGEKSIAMIHVSEITGLTGYVRGGCSPVGMKKRYRTVLDTQAQRVETLLVSAGKIGYQVELAPDALLALVGGTVADLTVDA
ncbi:MAG: Cys-tRNA(Pro) deacylase [Clostridiales bacterium]|nr:Cys-tRNA(Pro) deacylase [Clostridiales bacterium]MDD6936115.1 Cys-tRNA(Pro) deacylase [Clostridiales bacterium]MDY2962027.1 Cys-tRNA(Pro) deacylase [Oscillospiraceae bacterium]